MSTFYRLENKLSAPKYKVGFGIFYGSMIRKRKTPNLCAVEKLEYEVLKQVGKTLGARLVIASDDYNLITQKLKKGELDFAVSSIATLKSKAEYMEFSESYLPQVSPHGALFGRPSLNTNDVENKVLGVVSPSIQSELGVQRFLDRYRILEFATHSKQMDSLLKGNIHAAVMYSELGKMVIAKDPHIHRLSQNQYYDSRTAIGVHKSQYDLLPSINRAVEDFKESGTQEKLYSELFVSKS